MANNSAKHIIGTGAASKPISNDLEECSDQALRFQIHEILAVMREQNRMLTTIEGHLAKLVMFAEKRT